MVRRSREFARSSLRYAGKWVRCRRQASQSTVAGSGGKQSRPQLHACLGGSRMSWNPSQFLRVFYSLGSALDPSNQSQSSSFSFSQHEAIDLQAGLTSVAEGCLNAGVQRNAGADASRSVPDDGIAEPMIDWFENPYPHRSF